MLDAYRWCLSRCLGLVKAIYHNGQNKIATQTSGNIINSLRSYPSLRVMNVSNSRSNQHSFVGRSTLQEIMFAKKHSSMAKGSLDDLSLDSLLDSYSFTKDQLEFIIIIIIISISMNSSTLKTMLTSKLSSILGGIFFSFATDLPRSRDLSLDQGSRSVTIINHCISLKSIDVFPSLTISN